MCLYIYIYMNMHLPFSFEKNMNLDIYIYSVNAAKFHLGEIFFFLLFSGMFVVIIFP